MPSSAWVSNLPAARLAGAGSIKETMTQMTSNAHRGERVAMARLACLGLLALGLLSSCGQGSAAADASADLGPADAQAADTADRGPDASEPGDGDSADSALAGDEDGGDSLLDVASSDADVASDAASDAALDPDADADALADAISDAPAPTDGADGDDAAVDGAETSGAETTDADSADGGDTVEATDSEAWSWQAPVGKVLLEPTDPKSLPQAAFTDVTTNFGIAPNMTHSLCVAAADLDANGREDIVVVERVQQKATIHVILLGYGPSKGLSHVFTKVDTTLLLPTSACTVFDLTGDGKPDLLMGGASGLALYQGNGFGGFGDVSETWLPYIMDFSTWSPAAGDFDGDGDLDVFVGTGSPSFDAGNPGPGPACGTKQCGYDGADFFCALTTSVPNLAELQNRILIRGTKPPLVDATAAWKLPPGGLLSAPQPIDVDDDGKLDVFVSDDFGIHYLLHNVGGAFAMAQTDIGLKAYGHGMGFGVTDLDSDGKADLVLADEGPCHAYVQNAPAAGSGLPVAFVDEGGERGLHGATWSASSWAPLAADFNRDGYDDLFLGGALWTEPALLAPVTAGCTQGSQLPYNGHPNIDLVLFGTPQGGFIAQHLPTGPHSHFMAISQVLIDLDDDGDLDVVQARPYAGLTSVIRIWRNDLPAMGSFARVRLKGKPGNIEALGAVVSGTVAGNKRTRWLVGNGGYGGARARIAEFGLGPAAALASVQVRWPDGKVTTLADVPAGKTVDVTWP